MCQENAETCEFCSVVLGESNTSDNHETMCCNCWEARYVDCADCGCEVTQQEAYTGCDDESRCNSCHEERFTSCEDCGDNLDREDAYYAENGDAFCSDCYGNLFASCRECGCEEPRDCCINGRCGSCHEEFEERCEQNGTRAGEENRFDVILDSGYLTNRHFAVELEVIRKTRETRIYCDWNGQHDGSLSAGGVEYASGVQGGQKGIDSVVRNCAELEAKTKIDKTCGFHLHFDTRHWGNAEIARFQRLAKRHERFFFSLVPLSRHSNRFTKPLPQVARESIEQTATEVAYFGHNVRKTEKYCGARYYWVNTHSHYYRGTIEIRLHAGTNEADKVLRWAEVFLRMADFVERSTADEIDRIASGVELLNTIGVRQSTVDYALERQAKFAGEKMTDSLQNIEYWF